MGLLSQVWYLINGRLLLFHQSWKKAGLDLVFSNYRPVSNLSFISKLIEKAVVQQLVTHSESFAPLPVVQSAYRKNHSLETALIKVQNDILMSCAICDVRPKCCIWHSGHIDFAGDNEKWFWRLWSATEVAGWLFEKSKAVRCPQQAKVQRLFT
jgi:hypothetical protein